MKLLRSLVSAVGLLTILPLPASWYPDERTPPGRAMVWFPLVGAGLGGMLIGGWLLFHWLLPDTLAILLTLILWVGATGMLHLDGFSDCCDGLLVTAPPERRLEILRDSRVGSFAVVGIVLLLLAKYLALHTLLVRQTAPLLLLVAIPASSRWAMVLAAYRFPYARREGMGGYFRQGLRWPQLNLATLIWLVILLLLPWKLAVTLLLTALISTLLLGRWAASRLGGGITGDVYGAIDESVEILCLLSSALLYAHSV